MDRPETVYGVDFSGAKDAARNVWVAGGSLTESGLVIETLSTAADLFDGVVGRTATHEALVAWLRARSSAVVGLDFSFGVPARLAGTMAAEPTDWPAFLDAFPPADCADADAFEEWGKARTRALSDGERTFWKRETDGPVGASSPYGFIGSTITYYGVRDVVAPLVRGSDGGPPVATAAPMQGREFEPPLTILEAYPAGTLDRLGLTRQNYKGGSDAERRRRARNLDGLTSTCPVSLGGDVARDTIVENTGGDALDAVVAATAAMRAVDRKFTIEADRYDPLEGYIYV